MTLDIFNPYEEYFKGKPPINFNYFLLLLVVWFVVWFIWFNSGRG